MNNRSIDRILGISAIVISLLTLLMFIYQTNIIHKQSRLSVMPRLSFSTNFTQNDSILIFSTQVKNKGIGPAILNNAKILFNGKEYKMDFESFFEEVYPKLEEMGDFRRFSNLTEGSTLTPNETKVLFKYELKEENIQKVMTYMKLEDEDDLPFNLIIDYNSMYNEQWRVDMYIGGHPERIK